MASADEDEDVFHSADEWDDDDLQASAAPAPAATPPPVVAPPAAAAAAAPVSPEVRFCSRPVSLLISPHFLPFPSFSFVWQGFSGLMGRLDKLSKPRVVMPLPPYMRMPGETLKPLYQLTDEQVRGRGKGTSACIRPSL